jgi:5-formyltetrahydrofolate cyclo-ligase
MPTKNELRKTMKALLAALPPDQFAAEGGKAAERLAEAGVWKQFRRTLLYCSMPGEIATRPLINLAFRGGKEAYFPVTAGGRIRFYRADSEEGPWTEGAYGIREPAARSGERLFRPEDGPFLVITPGLAFDRSGNRMGRGGGFYDRFFAEMDSASAVYRAAAFCLDCQILPEVPVESLDKKVDALCAAGEFLVFHDDA